LYAPIRVLLRVDAEGCVAFEYDRPAYAPKTLAVTWNGLTIADVLGLTVERACDAFADEPSVLRPLLVLRDLGLGYLRLGQAATELSGGETQRIKLASEL
jgi:excinuclease ABC subunit A